MERKPGDERLRDGQDPDGRKMEAETHAPNRVAERRLPARSRSYIIVSYGAAGAK